MPRIGSLAKIAEVEKLCDQSHRYIDLAVRLRVLTASNQPGELLPQIIGGRWDTECDCWVYPTPSDIRAVEWTIQEQQIPIFLGIPSATMLVAIFAGRQAGKTRVGLMEVARDALRFPGQESFVVSLDFKASREVEDSFGSLLDPAWGVQWIATERTFRFPHGHAVKFRSAENIAACRGPSTKTLMLDEAALMPEEAFLASVGSGMASRHFRLLITTTPRREVPWIRKIYQEWGSKELEGSVLRKLRTEENPRRNRRLLKLVAAQTPADLYAQEFRGELVAPQDAAYAHLFNRALHIRPLGKLPESVRFKLRRDAHGRIDEPRDVTRKWCTEHGYDEADYIGGWDFQKEACFVAKVFRDARVITERLANGRTKVKTVYRDRLWIVRSFVNLNTTTDMHAAYVASQIGTSIGWITDAMGAHDRSGGRGDVDDAAPITILREHGFTWAEPVAKRNPPVEFRHRTLCRALRSCIPFDDQDSSDDGKPEWPDTPEYPGGEVRLFLVPKGAPEIEAGLENQRMNNGKPVKDGIHEHIMDALGYLCLVVLPIEESSPEGWESPYVSNGGEA